MKKEVIRIAVAKIPSAAVGAVALKKELEENLKIKNLLNVEIANLYDIMGMSGEQAEGFLNVLAEPMVDTVTIGEFCEEGGKKYIFKQSLPGQFDQRADSAEKAALLSCGVNVKVRSTVVYAFTGVTDNDLIRIEQYLINPIESMSLTGSERLVPLTLENTVPQIEKIEEINGFNNFLQTELETYRIENGLAMSLDDITEVQKYFLQEGRNPNLCELKVLDTYWSDHCRHTTFETQLVDIKIDESDAEFHAMIKRAFDNYLSDRKDVYGEAAAKRPVTFMDLATINMKRQKKLGNLPAFIDDKVENNACTIRADVNGEAYQILFKNETHNHPTEIEPFGGAATCLGGAIRDPLSGRAYVYQAMRVSGAGDITQDYSKTIPGKLPQSRITRGAAGGFSSYGNQIGLATGHVREYYHPGFVAKRMEVGFVVGAVPAAQVKKSEPVAGDVILLIGGRTGRDGVGGATGSSKAHDEKSLATCGAEVQKGNAPIERCLQRLFRNPNFSKIIKKCNDFGAGGVSVAVGELANSIDIELNKVPLKYDGLNPMEIALSESQERMAVAISGKDLEKALALAESENLQATHIATVTGSGYVQMFYNGTPVVRLSRKFLNAAGARRVQAVYVKAPKTSGTSVQTVKYASLADAVKKTLKDLNAASQKGLVEMFDSTVGGRTVLHPFSGATQNTPTQGSVMLVPRFGNYTTATVAACGYDPYVAAQSPFNGARSAIIESLAKIVAMGGDYKNAYLSFQEYMPRQINEEKFGDTLATLLGANETLREFNLASIGGKDSMSGSFKDINVPPTLISFALSVEPAADIISPDFKTADSTAAVLSVGGLEISEIKSRYDRLVELIKSKKVISAFAVQAGGYIEAVAKMCFGNELGFEFAPNVSLDDLSAKKYGDIIVEFAASAEIDKSIFNILGATVKEKAISLGKETVALSDALKSYESKFESVFRTKTQGANTCTDFAPVSAPKIEILPKSENVSSGKIKTKHRVNVVIPVFFGANSEDELARAFKDAGAEVNEVLICDLTQKHVEENISRLVRAINNADIIAIPGGFTGGDEPDGSAKLIVSLFRNPEVVRAVNELLTIRKGLMFGVCNGFQALIKLGLFRNGKIEPVDATFPTLGHNAIGRHISEYAGIKVVGNNSPWLSKLRVGDIYKVPVSHGEGRIIISDAELAGYAKNGQIFTQFVDNNGKATMKRPFNPNGSTMAIEGLISPCGRVLGKMGHTERVPEGGKDIVGKNIPGNRFMDIISAGVDYIEQR